MNPALVSHMLAFDHAQLYNELYKDKVTGALNRSAFEVLYNSKLHVVAIVDLDSLKYINDTEGHRTGDNFLANLVKHLQKLFSNTTVFRLGGDEFGVIYRSRTLVAFKNYLDLAQESCQCFSYGAGKTLAEADHDLNQDKKLRETYNLRAPRGERPPWM